jgi:hypothetical protein
MGALSGAQGGPVLKRSPWLRGRNGSPGGPAGAARILILALALASVGSGCESVPISRCLMDPPPMPPTSREGIQEAIIIEARLPLTDRYLKEIEIYRDVYWDVCEL